MSDIPDTDNKDYDVESLWISWCLTPDRMEIKYEDSNSASWLVNSTWDNDSMISGHQNLTMYLRAKDEEIQKLQAQLDECRKLLTESIVKECKCERNTSVNHDIVNRNLKLKAQLDEADRFIDCLEAETSSMDMCKKIKSYREKYKAVSE